MKRAWLFGVILWLGGCGSGGGGSQSGPEPPAGDAAASASPSGGPAGRSTDGAASSRDGASGPAGATDSAVPDAPGAPRALGSIVISEVMYHPVQEDAADEPHEFVELQNRGTAAVALAGWTLTLGKGTGALAYTFPAGAAIRPGQFLVIAKNPDRLVAVKEYGLTRDALLGPFAGGLPNGGGRLQLVDAAGGVVDEVKYQDAFPWPVAPDAFGASDAWFPEGDPRRPADKHRFRGPSLERVSADLPSALLANWASSPLEGGSPGRRNGSAGTPAPVIASLAVTANKATIGVSAVGAVKGVEVELFVDDVEKTGEPHLRVAAQPAGETWQATLPAQPAGSIVRYRISVDVGEGAQVVSPRATDPYGWHATFVGGEPAGKTKAYQLFLGVRDWGRLWENSKAGRVLTENGMRCRPNPTWDSRVPAVLVAGGQVYDVLVRYEGSRFGRLNGVNFKKPFPGMWPAQGPSPQRALSWNLSFPRYRTLDGKRAMLLNKISDPCPGVTTPLASRIMKDAGVPSFASLGWVRLFINGAYYHYMQEYEHADEQMVARLFGKEAPVGDLFKSTGNCDTGAGGCGDEGPWGVGDERPLAPFCGFSAADRYAATYDRATPGWKAGSAEVMTLIQGLDQARAAGGDTLRAFLAQNFDVDELLTERAVMNWMAPGDDFFCNHFLYRRAEDGRWLWLPYDFDLLFGDWFGGKADATFTIGQQGDASNRTRWWNRITDSLLRAYPNEYKRRLLALAGLGDDPAVKTKALDPAAVAKLVDEVTVGYEQGEANATPAGNACGSAGGTALAETTKRIKAWITQRHAFLKQTMMR